MQQLLRSHLHWFDIMYPNLTVAHGAAVLGRQDRQETVAAARHVTAWALTPVLQAHAHACGWGQNNHDNNDTNPVDTFRMKPGTMQQPEDAVAQGIAFSRSFVR